MRYTPPTRARLLTAKTVLLLNKPLDPTTQWAARTLINVRLRANGIPAPSVRMSALRVARAVQTLAAPANTAALWAARIVTTDRVARQRSAPSARSGDSHA